MAVIHPVYLPLTRDELREHFAPVASAGDVDRHLKYYEDSAKRAAMFEASPPTGSAAEVNKATALARQMQKDERFWVAAALTRIFHAPNRLRLLTDLLTNSLGPVPQFGTAMTWEEALGGDQRLYFEVNLPSPKSYKEWLADHLNERALIPWIRDPAIATRKIRLEGPTKVDAVLISPETGFAVLFEAKVLSDISVDVRYDALRNQIARNVDVLLDPNPRLDPTLASRDPDRSCFVLVTPELFCKNPDGRLYGHLMSRYREDSGALARDLPHRQGVDFDAVSRRLGWLTWEDCNRVMPGACAWLTNPPSA